VLVGRQVVVGQARNCDIVADEVSLDISEACAMAGKTIRVRIARARRELDSVLLVLVPDLSSYEVQITALHKKRAALEKSIAGHRARIEALRGENDVAKYLLLAGKLRNHELTLSPEQQVGWRRLAALVAPVVRTLVQLGEVVNELLAESNALSEQVKAVIDAREESCSGVDVRRREG
jgi:septal ring factor EnvC (AmiA/AmiB activator)